MSQDRRARHRCRTAGSVRPEKRSGELQLQHSEALSHAGGASEGNHIECAACEDSGQELVSDLKVLDQNHAGINRGSEIGDGYKRGFASGLFAIGPWFIAKLLLRCRFRRARASAHKRARRDAAVPFSRPPRPGYGDSTSSTPRADAGSSRKKRRCPR